ETVLDQIGDLDGVVRAKAIAHDEVELAGQELAREIDGPALGDAQFQTLETGGHAEEGLDADDTREPRRDAELNRPFRQRMARDQVALGVFHEAKNRAGAFAEFRACIRDRAAARMAANEGSAEVLLKSFHLQAECGW